MPGSVEHEGWRITVEGDSVAIDNRPTTDKAKAEDEAEPRPQSAVIPASVVKKAALVATNLQARGV